MTLQIQTTPTTLPLLRSSLARKAVELVYEVTQQVEDQIARGKEMESTAESLAEPLQKAVFYAIYALKSESSVQSEESVFPYRNFNPSGSSFGKLVTASSLIREIRHFESRQIARMAVAYVLGSAGYDFSYLVEVSLLDALEQGKLLVSHQDDFNDPLFCWVQLAAEVAGYDEIKLKLVLTTIQNKSENFNDSHQLSWSKSHLLLPMFYMLQQEF